MKSGNKTIWEKNKVIKRTRVGGKAYLSIRVPALNLEKILIKKKITKYGFAKMLGVALPNVSLFFKKGYNPKLSTLQAWALVLDCEIHELFEDTREDLD